MKIKESEKKHDKHYRIVLCKVRKEKVERAEQKEYKLLRKDCFKKRFIKDVNLQGGMGYLLAKSSKFFLKS